MCMREREREREREKERERERAATVIIVIIYMGRRKEMGGLSRWNGEGLPLILVRGIFSMEQNKHLTTPTATPHRPP